MVTEHTHHDMLGQLAIALQTLVESGAWDNGDQLEVKIGGMRVSGLSQTDSPNPKWSPNYGDTQYSGESFIVIQNKTKRN